MLKAFHSVLEPELEVCGCVYVFQYEMTLKAYAEENKMQPDDFFGVFDLFLTSFADARLENEKMRRQKEEEEKRAKIEEQVRGWYAGEQEWYNESIVDCWKLFKF